MCNIDIVADMQVVVLMGGLGTRLGLKNRPKAMAEIDGYPFFDYQLKLLKRWKFHKFLFLVGHHAECIENYYGNGAAWDVEIQYSYDGPTQRGTGGALKNAQTKLEDQFMLLYGDSFMDIDYQEIIYRYYIKRNMGSHGIMAIFENEDQYDKSNVVYEDGKLLLYDKVNIDDRMHYIDYGVLVLSKDILNRLEEGRSCDLAEVLNGLTEENKLSAQVVVKRFYEIGNPYSMKEFAVYVHKRFMEKKSAVFFDRDGVINELHYNDDTEQIDSPFRKEEFHYRENVLDVLEYMQEMGCYIFIVTNQPAAAKGKVPLEKLYDLNTWMIQDLRKRGIDVEFSNLCPHYPVGSPYTIERFLIRKCRCRKPEDGMITDLLSVYNIDLNHSYMVGDSYTDIIAGNKAGLKTVLLGSLKCDMCKYLQGDRPYRVIQDISELSRLIKEDKE